MRASGIFNRWLAWPVIIAFFLPLAVLAQDSGQTGQANKFKKEELAQMLAPIALYPDSLVADILMASTYPLEIVEAERWLRENKGLKNDALNDALRDKPWDASIKVLCHFPEVLISMSEKLDQTRKLGDAFLGQQEEVMATVQELRRKAVEQGNLKSTKEQNVVAEKGNVKIEPATPGIVYVPVYDPLYVYGPWWYPAYPPYYWYWPSGVYISGGHIGFSMGFFIGFDLFSWFWFDWPLHVIYVDHVRARHYDRYWHDHDRPYWRHNPYHRRGVAYRDRHTSEYYGGTPFRVPRPTYEKRGYPERRPERATEAPRATAPVKPKPSVTPAPTPTPTPEIEPRITPRDAPSPAPRLRGSPEKKPESVSPPPAPSRKGGITIPESRPRMATPEVKPSRERSTAFTGVGQGGFERQAGERGERSRRSEKDFRRDGGPEKSGKEGGPRGGHKSDRRQK